MKQLKKIAFITSTCALIFGHVPDVWASSNNEISEVVQQSQAITGVVVDSNGEPIIGANVVEKGTTNGIITDFDGKFKLNAKPNSTLIISFIGYQTLEVAINNQKDLRITLKEDTELLDEVVVVGYGVQKKKLLTGATINITGETIQKQNTTHAIGALYSSVPGVNITQSNGQPWSGYNITVRGLNTTGSSGPLYVIDGVAGGSISSLNASDIESIDILKDAASAAIYGARASGGVILVTTKQGSEGKVNVSYDGYYAIQQANFNGIKSVTATEYINLVDEAFRSNGTIGENEHYWDLNQLMPIQYADIQSGKWNGTDWLRESENKNAPTYNHSINITGGNKRVRFSLGYSNSYTEGTLGHPKKTYYKRSTVRANTDYSLWTINGRDILKIGENATISIYDSNGVSTGNIYGNTIHTALTYTPLLPAYNKDGSFYSYENQLADGWQQADGAYNLLEDYNLGKYEGKTYRLQSNFWLEFTPHADWKLRSVLGFKYYNSASRSYTPTYQLSGTNQNDFDDVQQQMSISTNYSWETTLSWNKQFGEHHIDALGGFSMEGTSWGMNVGGSRQQTKFGSWESANLSNCESDIDPEMVNIWGGNTVPYTDLVSFFGRANYNYKETYMATLIMRADGSCNFARGHRWGYFPSVSAGWVITNENFMEDTKDWLDFFKLRASWGQNGNCSISNFQYLATVSLNAPYDFTMNGMSISTGAYPDIIPNGALTWETTEQTNIGFDARFINNRLGLTFDWYRKDTKDWLVDAPSLASYGTGAPTINGGAVRNQGIEIGLTWNDKIGDFRYNIGANLSKNKNKVLYIDNADGILHGPTNVIAQNISSYNTFEARPGKPIGYFTGIASEGIFQNQAQIDAYKNNDYAFMDGYEAAKPGDVIWIDQNKDGKYNNDDIVEIGNPHPDFNMGFNINMEYKGFDLSINGSGAFGHQILQSYRSFANSDTENYTNNFVDRLWNGEGSTNSFPRFTYGKHNNFYCKGYVGDVWVQDADYVKVRNITIGYDLKKLFNQLPVSSLRIYFTGQNLFTFTGYDGMDPEVGYGGGYSWSSGIDIGYYPSPKVYMAGVSVKF